MAGQKCFDSLDFMKSRAVAYFRTIVKMYTNIFYRLIILILDLRFVFFKHHRFLLYLIFHFKAIDYSVRVKLLAQFIRFCIW